MILKQELRKRRSSDPILALHYQLTSIRTRGDLEAVVLVDDTGCLLAGAGSWPVCEELAAFSPFLADGSAACSAYVATRTATLACDTQVKSINIGGMDAIVCAKGVGNRDMTHLIDQAAGGCRRILSE